MAIHGWLGPIAAGWPTAALWTVGKRSKTKNHGLQEKNLLSLSYGNVVKRDIADRSGLVPESYETYQIVEPGDVIFRFTDLQNDQRSLRSALVDERGIMTSAYINFRPNANIIMPSFLAYFMRATDQAKVFYEMGSGVRQTLNYEKFARLQVPLPSLAIQRVIADYLDRETAEIDAMTADLDKMEVLLTERRVAYIGRAVRTISGPSKRVRLQSIAKIHAGETITAADIEDDGLFAVYGGNGVRGYADRANEEHDRVLVGRQGALCGNVHLARGPFFASEHALVVEPHIDVDLEWLALVLSDQNLGQLSMSAAQPGITAMGVGLQKIDMPGLDEQRRIAAQIDRETAETDAMLADITELRDLLAERRAAVIAAAVTGQIDIPAAEETIYD